MTEDSKLFNLYKMDFSLGKRKRNTVLVSGKDIEKCIERIDKNIVPPGKAEAHYSGVIDTGFKVDKEGIIFYDANAKGKFYIKRE